MSNSCWPRRLEGLRESPRDLWLVLTLKFLEGIALFAGLYILVKYLSDDLGFSDVQAGWIFAAMSGLQFPLSLILSGFVDSLGVLRMAIVGETLLLAGRLTLVLTRVRWAVILALLTLYPAGQAVLFPTMVVAVKKYCPAESRPHAFGIFYVLLNVASLCVAGIVHGARHVFDPSSLYIRLLRLACVCNFLGLGVSLCLRRPEEVGADGQERPAEAALVAPRPGGREEAPKRRNTCEIASEAARSPTFWRFVAVSFSFVMVRLIFGHMKATVPKWMTREFGEATPFELFVGLNPLLIIFLVPLCTWVSETLQLTTPRVLVVGAVFSGGSPLWLAFLPPSLPCVALFVVTFSIGEALWSPRLYEYTVAQAKEGAEGFYASFTGAPLYLSKFLAGVSSGYLLNSYCPGGDGEVREMMIDGTARSVVLQCHTRALWSSIFCMSMVTPVVLTVFYGRLFPSTAKSEGKDETSPLLARRGP